MSEDIPDDHRVVRFFLASEIDIVGEGTVLIGMNAKLHDPTLSVDWLERTDLESAYGRKPKSEAHGVWVVKTLRDLEEDVVHDPVEDNYAHSEVRSPNLQKRDKQQKWRLIQLCEKRGRKPL